MLLKNDPRLWSSEAGVEAFASAAYLCEYRSIPAPPALTESIRIQQNLNGYNNSCKYTISVSRFTAAKWITA